MRNMNIWCQPLLFWAWVLCLRSEDGLWWVDQCTTSLQPTAACSQRTRTLCQCCCWTDIVFMRCNYLLYLYIFIVIGTRYKRYKKKKLRLSVLILRWHENGNFFFTFTSVLNLSTWSSPWARQCQDHRTPSCCSIQRTHPCITMETFRIFLIPQIVIQKKSHSAISFKHRKQHSIICNI